MHHCTQHCVAKLHAMLQVINTRETVARDVAEVGADSSSAKVARNVARADTRCNSQVSRNVAPCVRSYYEY